MHVADIPTPALLLDKDLFLRNLDRMAERVKRSKKRLRPHAKAHKCADVAKRQVQAGAVGLCVATVAEAEHFANAGISDLLLTSPLADPLKCLRIASVGAQVSVVVDHSQQIALYEQAAKEGGRDLRVLVDLDVGDHRTGIPPGEPALQLAREILRRKGLTFGGLQAYSVRASHMRKDEGLNEYSTAALDAARRTQLLLEAEGIACPEITGGSTGSYSCDVDLAYLTELQAGSYVFMDAAYRRLGVSEFTNALTVLATVISTNQPDRVTVDAGYKAFATDRPFGPEVCDLEGAEFQWAGDEFGYVFLDRSAHGIGLGDRVRFLPPHCDPNVNLYDRIHVCRGDKVEEIWPVMDRYHAR